MSMKQAKVLTEAELKRVLAVAAQSKHAARNRIALLLSHYAGLRVGEIATLCWSDLLGPDGEIKQQFMLKAEHTKSNEARPVHVSAKLQKELTVYKSCVKQLSPSAPLVPSQKRGPFSATAYASFSGGFMRPQALPAHPHTVGVGGSSRSSLMPVCRQKSS